MISVITASVTTRWGWLQDNLASVNTQTLQPFEHLVAIDHARIGQQRIQNKLADIAAGEWLVFLDDDDTLDLTYLEELWLWRGGAEVVYADCRTIDEREDRDFVFTQYNRPFDIVALNHHNIVPPCAMVKAEWFHKVGGYRIERGYDWDLWRRLSAEGARFMRVPKELWTYRIHGKNYSFGQVP